MTTSMAPRRAMCCRTAWVSMCSPDSRKRITNWRRAPSTLLKPETTARLGQGHGFSAHEPRGHCLTAGIGGSRRLAGSRRAASERAEGAATEEWVRLGTTAHHSRRGGRSRLAERKPPKRRWIRPCVRLRRNERVSTVTAAYTGAVLLMLGASVESAWGCPFYGDDHEAYLDPRYSPMTTFFGLSQVGFWRNDARCGPA